MEIMEEKYGNYTNEMTESRIQSSSSSHTRLPQSSSNSNRRRRRRSSSSSHSVEISPKHVTNKNKVKHIKKISHININIYDKTATSQQNSDYDVE
jgi:stage III sporulation protein SpoIIIAA